MRFIIKTLGILVGIVIVGVITLLVVARFSDGPLEIVAGGPFTSGTVVEQHPDWSTIKDVNTVQFQLLDPAASRTTWLAVHEGRLFIPSGYMTTWWGKIWKQWPAQAEKDGRALLRVDDKIYEVQLKRILDDPAIESVMAEISRKYAGGQVFPRETFDSGYLWIFELLPRQ